MFIISFFMMPLIVFANQDPRSLAFDSRMKKVAYNAEDVVTIIGSHLVETGIKLNTDEVILSVMIGDPLAWDVHINKKTPFLFFIKPTLELSDTNMTVTTDKRLYQFHLMTHADDMPSSKRVTYFISFQYPDQERAEFEDALGHMQGIFFGSVGVKNSPLQWNYNYSFVGSRLIAPVQAVDNGTFTVFKFSKNTIIPAIFAVDAHQNESLINFRVQNDYVFITGVHHQYTLRNGRDIATVYNDNK